MTQHTNQKAKRKADQASYNYFTPASKPPLFSGTNAGVTWIHNTSYEKNAPLAYNKMPSIVKSCDLLIPNYFSLAGGDLHLNKEHI